MCWCLIWVEPNCALSNFQVFNSLYNSDENVFIAAPTGSGKTVCAELALFRLIMSASTTAVASAEGDEQAETNFKCVYVTPHDEQAEMRYQDWQTRFGTKLGKRVVRLTGETSADLKLLARGQVSILSISNIIFKKHVFLYLDVQSDFMFDCTFCLN